MGSFKYLFLKSRSYLSVRGVEVTDSDGWPGDIDWMALYIMSLELQYSVSGSTEITLALLRSHQGHTTLAVLEKH